MTTRGPLLVLSLLACLVYAVHAFVVVLPTPTKMSTPTTTSSILLLSMMSSNNDEADDEENENLMAQLQQAAAAKGVELTDYDLQDLYEDDDDDDDEDDDDEQEPNIPQGAMNAFLGYDAAIQEGDKLAGNVSLTDNQLYSEVKERVLDTAGGFVQFVTGASEEDEEDDENEGENKQDNNNKPYEAPTNVPDSDLTAGEVCQLVLEALRNNDNPSPNKGVEILFGYSSPSSQIQQEEGLTPTEYADYLKETEYKVLFDHEGISIDKGKYSHDGKKAFFDASLQVGPSAKDWIAVNFILSEHGTEDNRCWLIDSLLIRPKSMQRRRRR